MSGIDSRVSDDYWSAAQDILVSWLNSSNGEQPYRSRFRTPTQLRDQTEALQWLIYGLIPAAGIGRLVGPPGEGKTFVALDLAMRLVRSAPSWYENDIDRHGYVVYVLMEGSFDAPNRVSAWELRNPAYAKGGDILVLPEQDFDMADEDSVIRLAADIESWERGPDEKPIAMVIVDTQALSTPGTDENDNTALGMVIKRMKAFAAQYQTCVLLVHHPSKSGDSGGRGAGSVRAALDFEIELKNHQLKFTKNKYGPLPSFAFSLDVVELGYDDQKGRPVRSCWAKPGTEKQEKALSARIREVEPSNGANPVRARLIDYLSEHDGASKSAVCKALFGTATKDHQETLMEFEGEVFTVKLERSANNRNAPHLYLLGA